MIVSCSACACCVMPFIAKSASGIIAITTRITKAKAEVSPRSKLVRLATISLCFSACEGVNVNNPQLNVTFTQTLTSCSQGDRRRPAQPTPESLPGPAISSRVKDNKAQYIVPVRRGNAAGAGFLWGQFKADETRDRGWARYRNDQDVRGRRRRRPQRPRNYRLRRGAFARHAQGRRDGSRRDDQIDRGGDGKSRTHVGRSHSRRL